MTYEALKTLLCVLEKIKYRADLTPEPTEEEIKEKRRRKEELEKMWKEIKTKIKEDKNLITQGIGLMEGILIPSELYSLNFELLEGKKIRLYREEMTECRINFEDDLKNLLKKLKKEYGIIIDFREVSKDKQNCYEIALPKDFDKKYKKIQGNLRKILSKIREREGKKKEEGKEFPIQKIEITKIPPLEFRDSKEKRLPLKIRLKSMPIRYDDNEPAIIIGNQRVPLPPFKNEHYFCRAMFEHLPNESIDWSLIYEKMTGYYEAYYGKPLKTRANWRLVYDTMRSVNQRIKEIANTNDNLFTWQEKSVKRNY